jgi:pimeloyl-ACP methyl ester carboxylesterase
VYFYSLQNPSQMHNILIHGIDSVLGSYVAARYFATSSCRIFYFLATNTQIETDLAAHVAGLIVELGGTCGLQEIQQRLCRIGGDSAAGKSTDESPIAFNEAWCFANSQDSRNIRKALDRALTDSAALGCKEFNWVEFDAAARQGAKMQGEQKGRGTISNDEVAQLCKAHGLQYRLFQTSMVLGHGNPVFEHGGAALSKFLFMVHSFKAEIEGRSPQYFDFKALRCVEPADGLINIVTASLASELLVRLARLEETQNSSFSITNPQSTAFSDLCEHIGIAYNLGLLSSKDLTALNAVDRSFHQQIEEVGCHIAGGAQEFNAEAYVVANLPHQNARIDEERWIAFFESVRHNHDKALAANRQRVAEIPGRLRRKTVSRDKPVLEYFVGGEAGPVIVLLNALGQGLECWYRLLDALMLDYRVIIWEPRGTAGPPLPFGMSCQVDDLDAVLRQEGVDSCHLVGWCTGPKVAIEFYLRRPLAVRSMAFLNGTLKCDGSPEELDSSYERNLETLCRMVVRKPAMATSVQKTLQSPEEKSEIEILEGPDHEEMSVTVLSLMNADLKSFVLAPFRSIETTINYAHQMVDFWAYDVRAKSTQVQVPTLLISAEYDAVATPAATNAAVELLPKALHVHIKGATHYCLYDRPKFVAGLLKAFFANPALATIEEPSAGRNTGDALPPTPSSPESSVQAATTFSS